MQVVKRDGQVVEFNSGSIFDAVQAAAIDSGYDADEAFKVADEVTAKVVPKVASCEEEITVEGIQDIVEKVLMISKYKTTAKSYIEYRHDRDQVREEKSSWASIGIDITSGEDTESQRENSNVPRNSVTTQVEMIKRLYSKKFANDFIIPERFKKAHNAGEIHIHDAENLVTKIPNCCLMAYPSMLEKGFQLGNKWIEKPNTILTTMNILVQMVQVQSNLQFGGLTLQDLDVHLGKYVLGSFKNYFVDAVLDLENPHKWQGLCLHPDDTALNLVFPKEVEIAKRKTEREVYRAAKLLSYQLNTLQVRGESSPFVTITYGHSTSWEGRLIQTSILQQRLDGFDQAGVEEFPKHMFNVRQGVNLNKGDSNYDIFQLAMKTSAKTCYPDYLFPDNQDLHTGGNAGYMG